MSIHLHIGDLRPFTPDDLAAGGDEPELGDIDLDNSTLSQDAELCVERILGVLLDREDGQLHSHSQFGAGEERVSIIPCPGP